MMVVINGDNDCDVDDDYDSYYDYDDDDDDDDYDDGDVDGDGDGGSCDEPRKMVCGLTCHCLVGQIRREKFIRSASRSEYIN